MIPVLTPAEMGAVDRAAPEPTEVLVRRAAGAVAREALDLLGGGYGRRVVVVAGGGNNGNDGRVAAGLLERRGVRTVVVDAAELDARASWVLGSPSGAGGTPRVDLVIDAAFGTGFRGEWNPPGPPTAPVLAVDIPSGIDGTTGEACGSPWRAVRTVTFAALKPGLLQGDGPGHTGEVVLADIGLDTTSARAWLVEDADVPSWIPPRSASDHKWRHAVWVVAGSPGMGGAAELCSRAAMRTGAGYVRLSTPGVAEPPSALEVVGTELPAAGWAGAVADGAPRFGSVVVGPGLGRDPSTAAEVGTAAEVRELVARVRTAVVVDGDGLAAFDGAGTAGEPPPSRAPLVLTPHDGEYERLMGRAPGADRLAAARDAAAALGAVVLLKGPTTVVADPAGEALVVRAGDERLATAGTGDVLSGAIGAALALGAPALRAAAAAAHLHGVAGRLAGERGVVASDVAEALPLAMGVLADPGA